MPVRHIRDGIPGHVRTPGHAPRHDRQLQPAAPTLSTALAGELVDAGGLAARAAEVAARQRSPETRRTYAAVYRGFGAFLGPDAAPADLTPEAVRAYRDALEHAGRPPATVAKHLSALRGLAEALGVETQQLRTVRSERVGRGEPRALTHLRGSTEAPARVDLYLARPRASCPSTHPPPQVTKPQFVAGHDLEDPGPFVWRAVATKKHGKLRRGRYQICGT